MINLLYITLFCLTVSFQSIAGNWNQSSGKKYSNDFSSSIYKNWATWNTTGPYPKAAKRKNGKLIITVTKDMVDSHTNRTGRFEIQKNNISKNLAVYQKFKVRSHPDNLINDRVLVAQIKQFYSGTVGIIPQAAVFLDRTPTCTTYSYKKYPKHKIYKSDTIKSYTSKKKNWYFSEYRQLLELYNRPFETLADGNWHTVEMDVYPHSKYGYCTIKIDGKVWVSISNRNTRGTYSGRNFYYDARIGIYRDTVVHSHTVEFDDWEIETYKPETGMRIDSSN